MLVIVCLSLLTPSQEGSDGQDSMMTASDLDDGGVVAAGFYNGTSWDGEVSSGLADFAAVKLDSAGNVVWRWQVSTRLHTQQNK